MPAAIVPMVVAWSPTVEDAAIFVSPHKGGAPAAPSQLCYCSSLSLLTYMQYKDLYIVVLNVVSECLRSPNLKHLRIIFMENKQLGE